MANQSFKNFQGDQEGTLSPEPWQSLLLPAASRTPDLELLLMLRTSPVPLTSRTIRLMWPAFESFLGSGLHWLHCLGASVKQGKMFKTRACKEARCCRALRGNKRALLVWTRSLLYKRAREVLSFALFTLLMLGKSAGYVFLMILP